jgi:opacity protein-like surface antigen
MTGKAHANAITVVMFTTLLLASASALAAPQKQTSKREGVFEITISPRYVYSTTLNGENGSKADISSNWGWGFGLGYNYTENWAFGFDIGWNSLNYTITAGGLSSGSPSTYSGKADTASTNFSATYNFSANRFTPFVSGSLGWVFLDSNIPSGPPGASCWYDPWWGYICSSYLPTHSSTDFTYGASVGLRYDISDGLFLRAGYNKSWIDFDKADKTDFDSVKIDIGFKMR